PRCARRRPLFRSPASVRDLQRLPREQREADLGQWPYSRAVTAAAAIPVAEAVAAWRWQTARVLPATLGQSGSAPASDLQPCGVPPLDLRWSAPVAAHWSLARRA